MNKVLKELRLQKGLTQEELARVVGIDRSMLSKIENGGSCSMSVAFSLANALGVSIETLFAHIPIERHDAAARDSA